jgi:beta-galactosidase beta subunit
MVSLDRSRSLSQMMMMTMTTRTLRRKADMHGRYLELNYHVQGYQGSGSLMQAYTRPSITRARTAKTHLMAKVHSDPA